MKNIYCINLKVVKPVLQNIDCHQGNKELYQSDLKSLAVGLKTKKYCKAIQALLDQPSKVLHVKINLRHKT